MTGNQDPSLWEMLGLDRNDTIPALLDELWERILEIATDPDTPDVAIDLIPDDIDSGDAGNDDLGIDSILLGDDTDTDQGGSLDGFGWTAADDLDHGDLDHGDLGHGDLGHDGLDQGADHDAIFDPGAGSDDLSF